MSRIFEYPDKISCWPHDKRVGVLANHYLELAAAIDQMDVLPQMEYALPEKEYAYLEEAIDYIMAADAELV